MSGIFVSYRRSDSAGFAGRLAEALSERFGRALVFRDIEDIEPGLDFVDAINKSIGDCDVLLVVMGPTWATTTNAAGTSRLENPEDFVRLEIEAALKRDTRIIPVLVNGAEMPKQDQIPESLQPILRRNAFEMSDARWGYDANRLIELLEKFPALEAAAAEHRSKDPKPSPVPPPPPQPKSKWSDSLLKVAGVFFVVFLIIAGVGLIIPDEWVEEPPANPNLEDVDDDDDGNHDAFSENLVADNTTDDVSVEIGGAMPDVADTRSADNTSQSGVALSTNTAPPAARSDSTRGQTAAVNRDLTGVWQDNYGVMFMIDHDPADGSFELFTEQVLAMGNNPAEGIVSGNQLSTHFIGMDGNYYQAFYEISPDWKSMNGRVVNTNTGMQEASWLKRVRNARLERMLEDY